MGVSASVTSGFEIGYTCGSRKQRPLPPWHPFTPLVEIMARIVSLLVLTALIVALGITFYKVIAPFLLPLFLAGVIAMLCQPLFRYFQRVTGGRVRVAAVLTTTALIIGMLAPMFVGVVVAALEIQWIAEEQLSVEDRKDMGWSDMAQALRKRFNIENVIVTDIQPHFSRDLDEKAIAERVRANLRSGVTLLAQKTLGVAGGAALGIVGTTASALMSLLIFIIALYYFLADGPAFIASAESLIPVHVHYQREMLTKFNQVVRAVALATILASIVQGLLTAGALYVAGFSHFFTLFVVAALASMIPLAGTWMVWGPCAIWLAYTGAYVPATLLTLFGAVVVGLMDNVVRTYVLNTDAKLHPLLAFVSVLGGLQVMGLWGIFIGPIVASCLYALVIIFNTELKELSRDRFPVTPGGIRPVVGPTPPVLKPIETVPSSAASSTNEPLAGAPTPNTPAHSGAGKAAAEVGRQANQKS